MFSSRSLLSFIVDIINIEKKEQVLKFLKILKYLIYEFDFIEMNTCIMFLFFDCVTKYAFVEFIIALLQLLDDYLLIFFVYFIQF